MDSNSSSYYHGHISIFANKKIHDLIDDKAKTGQRVLIIAGSHTKSLPVERDRLECITPKRLDDIRACGKGFGVVVYDNGIQSRISAGDLFSALSAVMSESGELYFSAANALNAEPYVRLAEAIRTASAGDIDIAKLFLSEMLHNQSSKLWAEYLISISRNEPAIFASHFLQGLPVGFSASDVMMAMRLSGITFDRWIDEPSWSPDLLCCRDIFKDDMEQIINAIDLIYSPPIILAARKIRNSTVAVADIVHRDEREVSKDVSALYAKTPYPLNGEIVVRENYIDRVNLFTSRTYNKPIPRDGRILIAGCGTVQAIASALSNPKARVVGIDITRESLEVSRMMAMQLGLKNIEFRELDILDVDRLEGEFDYIECAGVLHHMADPDRGLRLLRDKLSDDGIIYIMVYNQFHRTYFQRIQRISRKVVGSQYEASIKLLEELSQREGLAGQEGRHGLNLNREDCPQYCDTYLHPQERGYYFDELLSWLGGADLRIAQFCNPSEWDCLDMFEGEEMRARYLKLDKVSRWKLSGLLFNSIFHLWAEKSSCSDRVAPFDLGIEKILSLVLKRSHGYVLEVEDNIVQTERHPTHIPRFDRVEDGQNLVKFYLEGDVFTVAHKIVEDFYELVDGRRNIFQICKESAARYGMPMEQVVPFAIEIFKKMLFRQGMLDIES